MAEKKLRSLLSSMPFALKGFGVREPFLREERLIVKRGRRKTRLFI